MKTINFFKSLLVLAISLSLVQCTSDDPIPGPAGTQGTAGVNGTNGTNGLNGANGDNVCLKCHGADFKVVQPATFANSRHGSPTSYFRAGYCAGCHTSEGYVAWVEGTWNPRTATSGDPYSSTTGLTRKSCTTCHRGGHASAGLAISGTDAALRNPGAFTLLRQDVAGTDIIIDYKGTSNSCIPCHNQRSSYQYSVTITDPLNINYGKLSFGDIGPHYSPQVNLLEGISGQEITGTTAYPIKGSAKHRTNSSCTNCHMGAVNSDKTQGNHNFKINFNNCKPCHTTTDANVNGFQTKIENYMLELAEELVRVDKNFKINNYTGTKTFPVANITSSTSTTMNSLGKIISTQYVDPTDTAGVTKMRAYWNWRFMYYDHSHGVHNPKYSEALMKNTINALKALPEMP